ncbi:MAG: hypothetical protein OXI44_05290, partial [Bacteroidota bacterium]|nr:hypothetical protein [Bacteroidota bacterium]
MVKCLSTTVCCIVLVYWPQETNANHLLTDAVPNGTLINQQLEQSNEKGAYVISGFVVDAESTESLVEATPDFDRYGLTRGHKWPFW